MQKIHIKLVSKETKNTLAELKMEVSGWHKEDYIKAFKVQFWLKELSNENLFRMALLFITNQERAIEWLVWAADFVADLVDLSDK